MMWQGPPAEGRPIGDKPPLRDYTVPIAAKPVPFTRVHSQVLFHDNSSATIRLPRAQNHLAGVKISQDSRLDRHPKDHFFNSAVQFSTTVNGVGPDVASAVTLFIRNLFPSAVTS